MADEKLATAALPELNLNSQKDRDLRTIQLLEKIESLLYRIARNTTPAYRKAVRIKLLAKSTISGEMGEETMNLLLGEDAEISVTGIVDEGGNPATVEGDALNWSVAGDQDLGTLEVAADGKSAKFVRNGKSGTCMVEVRGDADLGPDQDIIVGSVELVCLGGKAVRFEMQANAVPKAV